MTLDEADKLAFVVGTADGGCSHCVAALCKLLGEKFPEFVWTVGDAVSMPDDWPIEQEWHSRIDVSVEHVPSNPASEQ